MSALGDARHRRRAKAKTAGPAKPNRPAGPTTAVKWSHPVRLAEAFARTHTVRFVKDVAYQYDGRCYSPVCDDALADLCWAVCEAETEYQAIRGQPNATLPAVTATMANALLRSVRTRRRLPDDTRPNTWLDGSARRHVLAVGNGLLDLDARTLSDHTSEWYSLTALPTRFDPKAGEPKKWLKLLHEVLEGDADRIKLVQQVFGVCLDSSFTWKHFVVFEGGGNNGKTTIINVLKLLLGDRNVSGVSLEQLATNRFATHALRGKLLNASGDEQFFESTGEAMLKLLTGGDVAAFEQKGKDVQFGVSTTRILMACNACPKFADKSDATWERLLIIPFTHTIPLKKRNPALLGREYWEPELPGILNWALDGLASYKRDGLANSLKVSAAVESARLDSDSALRFVIESCVAQTTAVTAAGELYEAYQRYMTRAGLAKYTVSAISFGRAVPRAIPGAKSKTRTVGGESERAWHGLRLRRAGDG
jgi:putative DNA primase/helicase